jgi:hypothetical protein
MIIFGILKKIMILLVSAGPEKSDFPFSPDTRLLFIIPHLNACCNRNGDSAPGRPRYAPSCPKMGHPNGLKTLC